MKLNGREVIDITLAAITLTEYNGIESARFADTGEWLTDDELIALEEANDGEFRDLVDVEAKTGGWGE